MANPNKRPATLPALTDLPADEVVADILSDSERRQDEMKLSPKERQALLAARRRESERQEKASRKAKEQEAHRIFLLLPTDLKERLVGIAGWNGTSVSQVVTFLLYEAVAQYEAGQIDFSGHKSPSYSPRYVSELVHPKDAERQQRRSAQKRKKGWG
jgi:hypothetical protein